MIQRSPLIVIKDQDCDKSDNVISVRQFKQVQFPKAGLILKKVTYFWLQ